MALRSSGTDAQFLRNMHAKESKEELEKAMSEKDKTEREILHSKGVQHYGYAHGINQALVELGFKHEKMKELYKCL